MHPFGHTVPSVPTNASSSASPSVDTNVERSAPIVTRSASGPLYLSSTPLGKLKSARVALMRERTRMYIRIYHPRYGWEGELYHPKKRYICVLDYSDECSCTPGGGCCPPVWEVSEEEGSAMTKRVHEERASILETFLVLCRIALEEEHQHRISPDETIQLLLEEYQRMKSDQTKGVSAEVAWKELSEPPDYRCSCDKVWRCRECCIHFTEGPKCPEGCKVSPYLSRVEEATPVWWEHGDGGGGGGGDTSTSAGVWVWRCWCGLVFQGTEDSKCPMGCTGLPPCLSRDIIPVEELKDFGGSSSSKPICVLTGTYRCPCTPGGPGGCFPEPEPRALSPLRTNQSSPRQFRVSKCSHQMCNEWEEDCRCTWAPRPLPEPRAPPPLPIKGLHLMRQKCGMCGDEECSCTHAPPAPREESD